MSILLNNRGTYKVQYPSGNIDVEVSDMTPNEIKAELAQTYAELANATVNVSNNVITFSLPSGQKNV